MVWHNGKLTDKNGRRYSDSGIVALRYSRRVSDAGRAVQLVRMPHKGKRPQRKVHGLVAQCGYQTHIA